MFLALVAVAPSLALLTFFYLSDRYDREPIGHVLGAYALGAFAMLAAYAAGEGLESWVSMDWLRTGGEPARLFEAFVLVGGVEEFAKWTIVVAAVYSWRDFDEPMDGLLYGAAVALGFAALENLIYLHDRGLGIAWQRALFAVPAHALFGGCMGYYVAKAKFMLPGPERPRAFAAALALSLVLPVAFHGVYDFALLHGLGLGVQVTITALSIAFWAFVLRRVRRAQRASPYRPKTMMPTEFKALPRKPRADAGERK